MSRGRPIFKRCACRSKSRCEHPWTVVASFKHPVTGKWAQKWETVRGDRSAAELRLAELRSSRNPLHLLDPGTTFGTYVRTRWLPHKRGQGRAAETVNTYESILRTHVLPVLADLQLDHVQPLHVQGVLDAMADKGLSLRTRELAYVIMSAAFRQAVRWQLLPFNPASGVTRPEPTRPDLKVPDYPAVRRVLALADDTIWEMPMTLAAMTGMRRSEVLGLRWSDVEDGREPVVRVTGKLLRIDGELKRLHYAKTHRGHRPIVLADDAVEALRRHRLRQAERRLAFGEDWPDLDLVCDRGDGHPLDPDAFTKAASRMAKQAGIPGVRLHDLRHAFATELLRRGVPVHVVAQVIGDSPKVLLSRYAHVLPGMGKVAAEAIQGALDDADSAAR